MAWPGFDQPELVPPSTRENLYSAEANFQGYLSVQHKEDGSHGDVTADSLHLPMNAAVIGTWTSVPYSSALFSVLGSSVISVSQTNYVDYASMQIGATIYLRFEFKPAITTATSATIAVALPAGIFSKKRQQSLGWGTNNTTKTAITITVDPAVGRTIQFAVLDGTAWAVASAGNTVIRGEIYFETAQSASPSTAISATGGTITSSGGRTIHTFTSSGTFTVFNGGAMDYLVVGGGAGGGAGAGSSVGAGGGAGGFFPGSFVSVPGSYTITVGAGGSPGNDGSTSSLGSEASAAGGGGGGTIGSNGRPGGSGGGASGVGTVGAGTSGQGSNGGLGSQSGFGSAGGGGGASAAGADATLDVGGAGGAGQSSSISGSSVTYAGGGGGSASTGGAGGSGGGGAGSSGNGDGTAGTANTGGGGGGSFNAGTGGAGGSGLVIISYVT